MASTSESLPVIPSPDVSPSISIDDALQTGPIRNATADAMNQDFTKSLFESYRSRIMDYSGIDIGEEAQPELLRRIEERMSRVGARSFQQYFGLISSRAGDELRRLTELITNNETYFFREPAHFEILRSVLIPDILKRKKQRRLRIWSAGCSTGEEVYTLAMVLEESRAVCGSFDGSVIGTDIDEAALAVARTGLYGRHSFRSIEPYYLKTYFKASDSAESDLRCVEERLRKGVRFDRVNLFDAHLEDLAFDIDVIFFRNVSIYFGRDKIRAINERLSRILNDGGYLLLGSSETLHHNFGHLKLIEIDNVFLYQKQAGSFGRRREVERRRQVPPGKAERTILRRRTDDVRPVTKTSKMRPDREPVTLDVIFAGFKDGRYSSCLSWIEELMASSRKPDVRIPLLVLRAHIHIAQENFAGARQDCLDILQIDAVHAEAFLLDGLARYYEKDLAGAVESLQKAVFLKSDLALPHFHLAAVYLSSGRENDARREYRNTIKVLEQKMDSSLSFAALGYSSEYLINSCRQHLKILA